jgi:hypothetical protein
MDKLARRSGPLSITTLTIINRIENPFPRWIDSFASLLTFGLDRNTDGGVDHCVLGGR